jgi:hypothetical protein
LSFFLKDLNFYSLLKIKGKKFKKSTDNYATKMLYLFENLEKFCLAAISKFRKDGDF